MIECKVIECNDRPGRESIRVTFPERTGEVVTLAVAREELNQFAAGGVYRLALELISPPVGDEAIDD